MSLTKFLSIPAVRLMFANEFPLPSVKLVAPMRALPVTKNYPLVGTAFDYLLRFYLQRLNPDSISGSWVAEQAVQLTQEDPELFSKTSSIFTQAKSVHADYIKNGQINDDVIRAAILLAQLDPIYRAGVVDQNLGNVLDGDIEDMRNLLNTVDAERFRAKAFCILNPTFGEASELVSGADADILIDGNLIDIKTTKNLVFGREHYNQLIGYYILSKIGGIDNAPDNARISHLSIYFSRHSLMHTIPVSVVEQNPRLDRFIKWFKGAARLIFQDSA